MADVEQRRAMAHPVTVWRDDKKVLINNIINFFVIDSCQFTSISSVK